MWYQMRFIVCCRYKKKASRYLSESGNYKHTFVKRHKEGRKGCGKHWSTYSYPVSPDIKLILPKKLLINILELFSVCFHSLCGSVELPLVAHQHKDVDVECFVQTEFMLKPHKSASLSKKTIMLTFLSHSTLPCRKEH